MIHPIGKNPVTMPSIVARMASPAGIVKAKIAIAIATRSAMMAATGALTLFEAMSTSSVTTGAAAARVERT